MILEENKTSLLSNGLIWFGAAVSLAEILTGTLIAPLGFARGMSAIVLGHIIGCVLLFLAGVIGGKTEKSAMETVKMSFGEKGAILFSVLNVVQLIGWTAVMIISGASAAESVFSLGGTAIWSIIIGALIIVWLLVGIKNLGKINIAAMAALFILSIVLSVVIFKTGTASAASGEMMSFGAAVELSVAMPLSWLPLISDYTRSAKKPVGASAVSAVVYFFISLWMYFIGMAAAICTGESDIAAIMLKAGLGLAALVIIIFSTVTTTFLDAYSAGVSASSITAKIKEKPAGVIVCVIGIILAAFTPITQFENFLYFIGSVFAPMIAIQIVDYFMLKKDVSAKKADWLNLAVWFAGFIIYRVFMKIDMPLGSTFPAMLAAGIISIVINKLVVKKDR